MKDCQLQNNTDINHALGEYDLENHMLSYNEFIPKMYNYCISLGFERDKIMPSRAFCSDENQGYPIILMAKHFGTSSLVVFGFNDLAADAQAIRAAGAILDYLTETQKSSLEHVDRLRPYRSSVTL